jgi:TolB-like protein/Flp pilus assembly protein TadD
MQLQCARRAETTSLNGYEEGVILLHGIENKSILEIMPPVESEAQAARRQLERVLESPGFARNERLSRFLRFVVERHLEGRDHELKESVIAIEILGRKPDYNPKQDPIVRTEAARLRARLSEYYVGEGRDDALVIELPKGRYTPAFSQKVAQVPDLRFRSRRLWLTAAVAGLALALVAMGWWWLRKTAPIAIAVLPLENLSHDPANDYFADGLTDELIRNLSIIDGLAPRSRTSSFAFRGKPPNIREVGKQLGADYILEGSVLRAGQQLRINAQLIRARDDFLLWSGRYDRELTDVLAIQDEISRGIVNSLRLKLGRGRRRYETSAEAYDLYLRARALGVSPHRTIGAFEEVIAKDPSFAPAYAGLAGAYAFRSGTVGSEEDDLPKMRAAAEKAIQLDPLLGEAHDALAIAYARYGQWAQSEKTFRRAIELDPNHSGSYRDFVGYLLLVLGRIDEALQQLRVAEKTDPLSPSVHSTLAFVLLSAGRYDEAAGHCQKLTADPGKSECLGRAWLGQGRTSEAVQVLATAVNRDVPADAPIRGYLGYAYGRAGRREEAQKLAAAASQNPFQQALIFAGLGDKERTLGAVERMAALGPARLGRDLTYPEFALIRGDPRVHALRKKVGLPN